ncbi:hypothetical protein GUJ93_ZPchr0002g24766 [Zizania palustris]|uniref:SAM-dependent MTase RsmB/NOP-type domain-containing protein n=1 Tax=Zizania palustris TaxID=103762 RepID=A0A8J5SFU5_ZIZPA|nr:hypothetical protein GUJ93_ZPchr0002g24766 [Zizania palustris]
MGGGRKRGRTQRRHFKQGRENVWKHNPQRPPGAAGGEGAEGRGDVRDGDPSWQPFATENPAFEDYYKAQQIIPEEEWSNFMNMLRKPLPATFRINASCQFFQDICSQLENDFRKSLETEVSDEHEEDAIRPLAWYPGNLAWHLNFSRMQLRRNQALESFHEFLKRENEVGNITRQEAVSMVPPLFLNVQPDHHILDMCAAPGSKTFQLLEMIHQSAKPGLLPNAMVVANDVDVQRCNLLIHQTKRIGDGTVRKAPDMWRKWNAGMGNGLHRLQVEIAMRGIGLLKVGGRIVYSTCSMNPVENEAVVAEILRRCGDSVELLDVSTELPELVRRPGVSSWKVRDRGSWFGTHEDVPRYRKNVISPSMFPSGKGTMDSHITSGSVEINTDAVDADMRDATNMVEGEQQTKTATDDDNKGGNPNTEETSKLKSEDPNMSDKKSDFLQKLSPIIEKQVAQVINEHNTSVDKAEKRQKGLGSDKVPLEENTVHQQEVDDSNVMDGHGDNETSNDKITEEAKVIANETENGQARTRDQRKPQNQGRWKGVDPVIFFKDEATIRSIVSFYGMKDTFPLEGRLVTRNPDASHVKRIYYVSKSVQEVLELNVKVGERLKITSLGLKIFVSVPSISVSLISMSFSLRSKWYTDYTMILAMSFRKDSHQRMAHHAHLGCLQRVCRCCFHTSPNRFYTLLQLTSSTYYNTELLNFLIL